VAQVRRRPPTRGGRPPPRGGRGRAPEPAEEEELLPPEPPFWERIILSRTFRLLVFATFASAGLALVTFAVGLQTIGAAAGDAFDFTKRQAGRLTELGSIAIADSIQDEGRRLWVETATPLPTAEPTATALPTSTPFPTPAPPRRQITTPTPPFGTKPQAPAAPGKPGEAAAPKPAPLPIDAAVTSTTEYFEILSGGDVRRALQYWAPDSIPEARSALDAAAARGEKYVVRNTRPQPLPQIGGVDVTVDLDVTDANGKVTAAQHRYQWRLIDNQWFITTRLQ
jgi:hypothetical protein